MNKIEVNYIPIGQIMLTAYIIYLSQLMRPVNAAYAMTLLAHYIKIKVRM